MRRFLLLILAAQAISSWILAQTPAGRSVLGTVTVLRLDSGELEIRPDSASPVTVKVLENTIVQRVAPGETNLGNAAAMPISGMVVGDRALVTMGANGRD